MVEHSRPGATPGTGRHVPVAGAPLPSLTSLRFVAALGVVMFHVVDGFQREELGADVVAGATRGERLIQLVLSGGGIGSLGPNLFFVLSGFVLYWAYGSTGRLRSRGVGEYAASRVARLFPVYLIGLGLGVVAMTLDVTCGDQGPVCTRGASLPTVGSALVMQQGWLPWSSNAFNGPSWTLSTEFFFYLLLPLLLPVALRLHRRGAWLALLGALLATNLWFPIALALPDRPTVFDGSTASGLWHLLQFAPAMHLAEFVAGLALGRLFHLGALPRLPRPLAVTVLIALGPVFVVLGRYLPAVFGSYTSFFANNGGLDVFFCIVIAILATTSLPLLERPRLVLLGEASYALYILHWPIWYLMAAAAPVDLSSPPAFWTVSAGYVVLLVLVSVMAYRFVEEPLRRRARPSGRRATPLRAGAPDGDLRQQPTPRPDRRTT